MTEELALLKFQGIDKEFYADKKLAAEFVKNYDDVTATMEELQ